MGVSGTGLNGTGRGRPEAFDAVVFLCEFEVLVVTTRRVEEDFCVVLAVLFALTALLAFAVLLVFEVFCVLVVVLVVVAVLSATARVRSKRLQANSRRTPTRSAVPRPTDRLLITIG